VTLLFSYGSNHPAQIAERLGHAVETAGAYAPGYARFFRGFSQRWGGGVATLRKKPDGVVFGLVATVTAADLDRMDRFEGVASGNYERTKVRVTLAGGGKKDAVAYVSTSKEFNPPTREYLEAVARTIGTHWSSGDGAKVTWRDITVR